MKEMMPNVIAIPKLESLPKELAERYVARTWLAGAEMVHDGDKSRIHRIFERSTNIPGIGDGKLRVDVRHWHHPDEALHRDQVRFEYVVPGEKGDRLVAEMHLNELEEDAFWLQHRYVQPEFREGKGIGSALLEQTEDWLRQVGEARGCDARLGLKVGQIPVFRWLQKQKYWILKQDKPILDEILKHPDRFIVESASDDEGIVRDPYVFRKDSQGRTREHSVRLRFEKRIPTGLPSPKTDNIMKHFVPSWDA
jgi:GNAT superfamily N-acetyltransferase